MIKKITLIPVVLCLIASAGSFAQTKSAMAAGDTLLRDSELKAKVYGDAPFRLTNNITGKTVVYTSSAPSVASIKGDTVTIVGPGNTDITATIASDTTATKKLTVYKKNLDVSTPSVWRVQGTKNPTFVITYSGFVNGDDANDLDSKPVAICNANTASVPGQYTISIMGGSSTKYNFWFDPAPKLTVVGVGLSDESENISLFPNPATDNVSISGISKPVTVAIINICGEAVRSMRVENGMFSVSGLSSGVYFVKISDGSDSIVKKLVVK